MLLRRIYLVFFLAAGAVAMEHSPMTSVDITNPVRASERLQLVEKILEQNPNASKEDIVPELYVNHYPRDVHFIQENIKTRDKAEIISGELKKLDDYVQNDLKGNLSFADYAYIGSVWASLLSGNTFKEILKSWLTERSVSIKDGIWTFMAVEVWMTSKHFLSSMFRRAVLFLYLS